MAKEIIFSSGMVYNPDPPSTGRVMFDPGANSEPQCTGIEDIVSKFGSGGGGGGDLSGIEADIDDLKTAVNLARYNAMHMVGNARGCININTSGRKLEITDTLYVYASDLRMFRIDTYDISWYVGSSPTDDTYYFIADISRDNEAKFAYVVGKNSDYLSQSIFQTGTWVALGVFRIYNGKVQGYSFCCNDIKIDGKYAYDNPVLPVVINGEAMILCDARGEMNINTADKTIELANDAVLILNDKKQTVTAGGYGWNRGTANAWNEAVYTVYVDVRTDGSAVLAAVASNVNYTPAGTAYRIGAFYWTGTEVGGINFSNDISIDGAPFNSGTDVSKQTTEITASGTWIVPAGVNRIDVFLVGGGGSGCGGAGNGLGGGGGGGYTAVVYDVAVTPGESLQCVVGGGGAMVYDSAEGNDGGATSVKRSAVTLASADGGAGAGKTGLAGFEEMWVMNGGHGGSGGGGAAADAGVGGAGGSAGSDGSLATGAVTYGNRGTGQGATTRCPFNKVLYAGGGGGGGRTAGGAGGTGGGGNGGNYDSANGTAGGANTGGGGGGGGPYGNTGYAGGSGIIIIQYAISAGGSGGSGAETVEEITASGSWTVPAGVTRIDAFLVGGGGSGAGGGGSNIGGGGGGGYAVTASGIPTTPGESLTFEIGAGGIAPSDGSNGRAGGITQIKRGNNSIAYALGGQGGYSDESGGGNGGSGGGAPEGGSGTAGGNGGSNGSDGATGSLGSLPGGTGQHTSTRCLFNGVLYAGGGGGARYMLNSGVVIGGNGGDGGGGNAGHSSSNGSSGTPNTGGGGGGCWNSSGLTGGNGGSGIIVLRYTV